MLNWNKKKLVCTFLLSSLLFSFNNLAFAEGEKETLVIMGTTDIHGRVYPIDYFTGKEDNKGLAKLYTKIKELRKIYKNNLLVDSGDLLQGTPLTNYFGGVDKVSTNPMVKAFNFMKYDAFGVGNHEYDYGLENLFRAEKTANFPFLSANTFIYGEDKTAFKPYFIKEVNGIKVGIVGFTTPGVAVWSKGIVADKFEYKDIVEAGKKVIPDLKKKVDVLIVIPHSGLKDEKGFEGYDSQKTGVPPENVGLDLAHTFPEIDALLLGHTHTEIKELFENGVLITQADKFGNKLALVTLELEKTNNKWVVKNKKAETIDIASLEPDKELLEYLKNEHESTLAYVNKAIGTSTEEWKAQEGRLKDTPIVDLINTVQKETTGADLSSSSLFNENVVIPKGNVSIANIASLYIYENTLCAIKITGKKLREYLEYSAKYYTYENGKLGINKTVPGYNYDIVSGVDYKIDISKPLGSRIVELKYQGKDVTDEMTFTMALNNYRQSGGGGYAMIKDSPLIYNKFESIRDLLIRYVQKKGTINPNEIFKKNWGVLN